MMHELWLGINRNCSSRERFLGLIQRMAIVATIRAYKPHGIHTSNKIYQTALKLFGFPAEISPIFGNIAQVRTEDANEVWPVEVDPAKTFRVVHFGRVHPPMNIRDVVERLRCGATSLNKSLALMFAGHTHRSKDWPNSIRNEFPDVFIDETGALDTADLSSLFQNAEAGLSSTPLALAGKSGSISAMREHGLPVLIARNDFLSRYDTPAEPLDRGCLPLWDMKAEDWPRLQRSEMYSGVDTVAKQLIQAMGK